jgi:large subunit ribosomal protein L35
MPKLKTHKATVKRVKASATGKLMRVKAAKSHLLTQKTARTKVALSLSTSDVKKVKRMAPYLK